MTGYFKIHRKLFNSPLWMQKPFGVGQALVDLIGLAAFKTHPDARGGTQQRGTVITSQLALSERWGWPRKRVRYFLARLAQSGTAQVSSDRGRETGHTTVVLTNYAAYQDESSPMKTSDSHRGGPTLDEKGPFEGPFELIGETPVQGPFKGPGKGHLRPTTEVRVKESKNISPSGERRKNGWALWVDVCRGDSKPDPVPDGPDTSASARLAKLIPDERELIFCMRRFLRDSYPALAQQGWPLRLMPQRLNAYRKMWVDHLKALAAEEQAQAGAATAPQDDGIVEEVDQFFDQIIAKSQEAHK
jgi:hypothetical protein